MRDDLHHVAAAGNLAALVVLIVLLCGGSMVGGGARPADSPLRWERRGPEHVHDLNPVLLVVLDGLRADTAADAAIMPALDRLRRCGQGGTVQVESLVPSTVAGLLTLTTGVVPAPTSFVFDFAAPAAPDGGIFRGVRNSGGRAYVAGPRLWTDLFGEWIDGSFATPGFRHGDTETLAAAVAAVSGREYELVVVHLGMPDVAAHEWGARSPQYAEAARWCDAAVDRLVRAGGDDLSVVVTSDHGVTDAGTHGGLEPHVATVPVVAAGPALTAGHAPLRTQKDVPRLVAHMLHLVQHGSTPARVARPLAPLIVAPLLMTVLLLLIVRGSQIVSARSRRGYTALSGAVWIVLVLLLLGWWVAALASALGVLVTCALANGYAYRRALLIPMAVGLFIGSVRSAHGLAVVSDAAVGAGWATPAALAVLLVVVLLSMTRTSPAPSVYRPAIGIGMAVVALPVAYFSLAGLAVAAHCGIVWLLSRSLPDAGETSFDPAALFASAMVALLALIAHLLGQSASLSSVHVQHAFHWADGGWGMAATVAAVIALQAAPCAAVLSVCATALRRWTDRDVRAVAVALSVCLAAQAVPAACLFAMSHDSPTASIAMGMGVRTLAETAFLFLGLALLTVLLRPARPLLEGHPHPQPPKDAVAGKPLP